LRIGNTESTFLKKSFGKIRIAAGRGDDLVTVGSDANPITLPVSVSGGDGSDTIIGGAGNDKLDGGAGADQIAGGAGNDTITGDNGNDDLHGGDGRDSLSGGKGDDELHDDAGRDAVFGNAGDDHVYYHDDVKQFRDAAKAEQTYSEPTFQVTRGASGDLVLNMCPLYAPDGSPITGGLVKAGGSTLVLAGNVLQQWGRRWAGRFARLRPTLRPAGWEFRGKWKWIDRFRLGIQRLRKLCSVSPGKQRRAHQVRQWRTDTGRVERLFGRNNNQHWLS